MNIFVTDPSPMISAQNLDDKRVVKMATESGQLLCTALRRHGYKTSIGRIDDIWHTAWKHHPVAIWTGNTYGNFCWTFQHCSELCLEYSHRYNAKIHSVSKLLEIVRLHEHLIPNGPLQSFQNSAHNEGFGLDFRDMEDVSLAYQYYLLNRWDTDIRPPKWTNRERPEWKKEYDGSS